MSNEIKVGDKVRVSSKLPKIYERFGARIAPEHECKVIEIDEGMALLDSIPAKYVFLFPLKYLVKADEEKKEAKFKVNDVMRTVFNETTHITAILGNGNYHLYGMGNEYPEDSLTLVEPYTEPTEEKVKVGDKVRSKGYGLNAVVIGVDGDYIAVEREDGIKQEWKRCMTELVEATDEVKNEKPKTKKLEPLVLPIEVDMQDTYWTAYAADLAKEVALKVANKYNDPKQLADYAVKVAKAVVEGLKRE